MVNYDVLVLDVAVQDALGVQEVHPGHYLPEDVAGQGLVHHGVPVDELEEIHVPVLLHDHLNYGGVLVDVHEPDDGVVAEGGEEADLEGN